MYKIYPALLSLLWAGSANSLPVQWTLQEVVLTDGSQVTGSFIYDADAPIDTCEFFAPGELLEQCHPDELYASTAFSDFDIQIVKAPNPTVSFSSDNFSEALYFDGYTHTVISDEQQLSVLCVADCFTGAGSELYSFSLVMHFAASLTNAGGTISLLPTGNNAGNYDGFGWYLSGSQPLLGGTGYVGGSVVASVVPVPAAVWLFASGLGFLGLFRRSKS
jgi:hypothetical protein